MERPGSGVLCHRLSQLRQGTCRANLRSRARRARDPSRGVRSGRPRSLHHATRLTPNGFEGMDNLPAPRPESDVTAFVARLILIVFAVLFLLTCLLFKK